MQPSPVSRFNVSSLLGAFAGLAFAGGCSSSGDETESVAQAVTGGNACDGVQLDASRQYQPTTWTDAHLAFAAGSLTFSVPSAILVTHGTSANGKTKFTFSLGSGAPTTCVYRGDGATHYNFVKCKRGPVAQPDVDDDDTDRDDGPRDPSPVAGTTVTADSFTLHVNKGSKQAGTTAVSLHLAGPMIADNDLCTVDTCNAGVITHSPVDIDDHNACTADACAAATGVSHTAIAYDDHDACTVDACDAVAGISHTPVNIDDNNACTVDACDAQLGTTHTAVAIDDGNACTADSCNALTGVSHDAVAIDDNDACTADSCDPLVGVAHTAVAIDDGNACTADACDAVAGVSHTALAIDDGNACTADACDSVAGVTHTAVAIDDNNACTADACDTVSGVTHTAVAIDDGNACTSDACTALGGVTHTAIAIADDHDSCTTDACDPTVGVTHTPVDSNVCRGRANFNDTELAGLGGNGRACATCHVESENFQLTPANAEARFQAMQSSGIPDPLFLPIDADDFRVNGDAASNFTNLRQRGLVRISIPLPPNVKLLNCGSQVPCPASAVPTTETVADVWRSTPSVLNVANTGPDTGSVTWPTRPAPFVDNPNHKGGYQLDGRVDTLQNQALGALRGHAGITTDPSAGFLNDIAAYESTLFSAAQPLPLSPLEDSGRVIFNRACASCHGGAAGSTAAVSGRYVDISTAYPRPVDAGIGGGPRWVYPTASQLAGNVRTYEFTLPDGFKVRKTTTDPGRALLTGFVVSAAAPVPPAVCAHPPCGAATSDDFQKFDIPGLKGIAHTAPYFINNSAATLTDVLDHYDGFFNRTKITNNVSPVLSTNEPGSPTPLWDRPVKRVDEDGGAERTALLAYLATL
ncbi:MAG: hypothetical protein JWO36_7511 [Myxococcales bacterium]|nr:hypothetical protein [Myxococcales bacterium]